MSIDGFSFEGRDVSARQLKAEIPAYGIAKLQSALEAGMQTRAAVVAFCERRLVAAKQLATAGGRASWLGRRV